MEMKRSYGFTRRKECWLSLYGRERKILLPAINGKFSNVAHERQLPQFLFFARQRNRRRRTAGGQSKCGVSFFSSKYVTKLSVGLGWSQKKKKNWPGGDDKFINMTIFGVPFFCAVAESVLEGSNGWQQLRRLKKLTLRVTVLKRTEIKQSDPTLTALSTI